MRAYAAEVGLDPEGTLREFLAQCPEEGTAIPTSEPSTIDGIGRESWVERVPVRQIAVGFLPLALAGAAVYAVMRWS